jgi:hypothetical protein
MSPLDSISKRSEKIFSIFSQTKIECEALNKEIAQMTENKKAEAQRILSEVTTLEGIMTKNDNLAKKIDSFINS